MKYFAHGSNMLEQRLSSKDRIPGAKFFAIGYVRGRQIRFHKRGNDGSGKCDIPKTANDSDVVWGVIFDVPENQIGALDRVEGEGYARSTIEVLQNGGPPISAAVYLAKVAYIDTRLAPYSWYRDLVVAGANQHKLPAAYIAKLAAVSALLDPNEERSAPALNMLKGITISICSEPPHLAA
jgi:gamma-glutamylcyclotransferase